LCDVNLCRRPRNDRAQVEYENCENENETRHTPMNWPLPTLLQQHGHCLSRFTALEPLEQKVTRSSIFCGQQSLLRRDVCPGCEMACLC
jgi:hypothetical protein